MGSYGIGYRGNLNEDFSSDDDSTTSSQEPTAEDHDPNVLYEIAKSDVVGRHMVAARDIQPGEVIFTDAPACIGPDNSSKPMCLSCYTKVDGSFLCPGCKWPMCSLECSKALTHKTECAIFRLRQVKITVPWFDKPCSYYDAILPIRVLLLKISNPKIYKLVCLLMDHNDVAEESVLKHRQRVTDFILKTCNLAKDFSEEEVAHVLGILSVNSFVVHDTNEDNMDLIGLYPWTSLMSHHCIANTKIATKEDFSYVCEATTFIPAGSEIVTSYHHYHYHFYGTAYRRHDLKSTWNFDCLCPRCRDSSEFGTLVSAVLCDKCKQGYSLPIKSSVYDSSWCCDFCFLETDSDSIAQKIKSFENDIDAIKSDNAAEYERLLRRMRYSLHDNHYWILDVKRKLIDIYGNKPGYELYKLTKDTLDRKSEYCSHLLELAKTLCPGASEMRGYLLWESHGVNYRLAQWKWIRMRINTPQYIKRLAELETNLQEVISILGKIRLESDEGQMCQKARQELVQVQTLIDDLSRQKVVNITSSSSSLLNSRSTSTPTSTSCDNLLLSKTAFRLPTIGSTHSTRIGNKRRSICI